MPNFASGLWGAVGGAASSVMSAVQGMGGTEFRDPGPVIGPPLDDGYLEPPEGDVWKGLPYPDDLYSEDNGETSGGASSPWGSIKKMIDKAAKTAGDAAGDAGGASGFEDYIAY